jgi:hypothetical protein
MLKTCLMASAAALALSATSPVLADARPQVPVTSDQGVLIFEPAFFADARPNTALDMVNRIPGFAVNDGDGSRGFEGAVGNILINGARPASKNDLSSSVLARTLASRVERIELIRGGATGIEMQGYAVVANVILKGETSSRQHILTTTNIFFEGGKDLFAGTYQFSAQDGERTWGFTLSDGMGNSDSNGKGQIVRRDASGRVIRSETYFNDAYGGGNSIRGNYASPFMGGKIDLTGRIGVGDWHNIDHQSSDLVFREALNDEDSRSGEVGAVYTRPLSAKLKLESRLSHDFSSAEVTSISRANLSGTDQPEQVFAADIDSSESILRSLVRYEHSPKLEFELGAEVAYNMMDSAQTYTVGGTPIPLPSATVKVEETRGEIFGKSIWRINPKWTLESGLRLEASNISQSGDTANEKDLFYAKPRALLSWTPTETTQVRLRLERTVGQLNFGDFAASSALADDQVYGGNVNLEPEARWVSELTFEKRFWEKGILSIGLRHDEIENAIDAIPLDGGLSATGNIGDGTLDQLAFNLVIPTDNLGISGGKFRFKNTWNRTEVTDPTTGEKRRISGVRTSQPSFLWEQDLPRWNLQWGANYIVSLHQPSYRPDLVSIMSGEDYWEFWAEYKPKPDLSIRAQVNLWDDFQIDRTAYSDRARGEVSYHELRQIDPRTFYQIRLRKTF